MREAEPVIVAVDGPAGSGKTTVARGLAERLGFTHVDTGALYRVVGLLAEREGVDLSDEDALARLVEDLELSFEREGGSSRVILQGADVTEAIRSPAMSAAASRLSAWPKVREGLLALQRRLALESGTGGAVLEGRDIGTVVFPDAGFKFFLTASAEERARRRYQELRAKGRDVAWEEVAADQAERDRMDESRAVSPLRPAEDAVVVDSTGLSPEQVIDRMEALVAAKR